MRRATTLALLVVAGCGGAGATTAAPADTGPSPGTTPARAAAASSRDWPMFGLDARRTSATNASTGITAASAPRLRRRTVSLPGTVDSSPIYVAGRFVMTTPYR